MKKMIFYLMNSIISTIFLSIRFAFSLFVIDKGYITESSNLWLNIFTGALIIILICNIYLAYKESRVVK